MTAVASSLERDLTGALDGEVRFDKVSRAIYASDASAYQVLPTGVVLPKSAEEVQQTLAICRRHGVSLTARGGGTSQGGQALGSGIQIDFSKYMRRVLAFDREAAAVDVEPGIVLDELNAWLKPHGLHLPLDLSTASRATIGGMIANNSSGTRSIVYGSTIDWVDELTVLLADGSVVTMGPETTNGLDEKCDQDDLEGRCYQEVRRLAREHANEIDRRYPKIRRRVGGYNLDRFTPDTRAFDLSKLIVGSEGTLGLVLKARLRLVAPPTAKVLAVAQFETLRQSLEATPVILRHDPSAVEVLDKKLLDMTRGKTEYEPLRDFIVGDPGAVLVVEFMGESPGDLPGRIDGMAADLESRHPGVVIHRAIGPDAQARIWKLRQAGLGLTIAQVGDRKGVSFVEDTAVSPDRLAEYIDRFQALLARHGTEAFFYAHASVGLLHIRPMIDMKTHKGLEQFEHIAAEVADLVAEFGGALSAEHGDGLVRSPFQKRMFGPALYGAFCEIKTAFDEGGVFNPGKIVDAPPLTASLKYGPAYVTTEVETAFDFDDFGGLARAAEQCGGVGACRKTLAGTMCPSYMATREEADSTRGRANALRLAISGQLGPDGLTDPALYPVLDLCLECKACKAECPTGVDMARIKSEFLDQYQKKHGASRRARFLAAAETTARWGSRLAPVSNWVAQSRLSRWIAEKTLGLDRRRVPPAFARDTFLDWWKRRPASAQTGKRVAVFADTFTNHYEPVHGRSVVTIAEALGQQVVIPPRVCCGRPLISKGFLDRAREQAEATVEALFPLAEAGIPIVFCEPGCWSAVKDDHPMLVGKDLRQRAEAVASAALTFEEWANDALDESGVELSPGPTDILLHVHCHQKTLVGVDPAVQLLSRIPGCKVTEADAGCCGMAGSFGYEREHYDVSRAVGEGRLVPAVRGAGDATLVAPGFSCRHQTGSFTNAEALSVMQVVAERGIDRR
jgi:FAD/FMN-containing dehydrogenase/Fe-S oxidoreductase